jgi:aarF domain-containing kinase
VEGKYPKLKLHVLDCGLALEMGPEQHANIVKVLGAFTRRDGTTAGQLMVDMKSESQASPEQRRLFVEGIEQICIMDEDQNFIECVGDYIADICSMACKHRVKLEGAFVNAALAVEIMEGLASALYPDLKVQSVALPLVVKAEMMVSDHCFQDTVGSLRDYLPCSSLTINDCPLFYAWYSIDWDGIRRNVNPS